MATRDGPGLIGSERSRRRVWSISVCVASSSDLLTSNTPVKEFTEPESETFITWSGFGFRLDVTGHD